MYRSYFVIHSPVHKHLVNTYFDFNFLKALFPSEESRWLGYLSFRSLSCCDLCPLTFRSFHWDSGVMFVVSPWSLHQLGCFDGQEQKTLADLGSLWSHISSPLGRQDQALLLVAVLVLGRPLRAGFLLGLGAECHWSQDALLSFTSYCLWRTSLYIQW